MLVVPLTNDAGVPGIYEFNGSGLVGTLNEVFPSGPSIPTSNAPGSRTVQVDQQIRFTFEWSIVGTFANMLNPAFNFQAELFFERYGPGEINLTSSGIFPVNVQNAAGTPNGPFQRDFRVANGNAATINVPANAIPPGVYDVVAVIRMLNTTGTPILLAAFAEFGKINFVANL